MDQIYLIPSDGLEIAAETFGEGPPIVFAHGLTGTRHLTRRQFAPLANRYRIVIYDQRGHCNSSPVTNSALYDVHRMANDLAAVMDYFDLKRAIVGGESMGSATTLTFALNAPERVKALLLTAPAFSDLLNPAADVVKTMGREIIELGMPGYMQLTGERLKQMGASPQVVATVLETTGLHNPASLAMACQTVMTWVLEDFGRIARLTMPTCVIAWRDDNLHPYAWAQRYASTIPQAHLETLPSLGAFFSDPAIVGRIYGKFLEQVD